MTLGLLTSLALGAVGLVSAGAIVANSSGGSVYYGSTYEDNDEEWDDDYEDDEECDDEWEDEDEEITEVATSIRGISKHVY